MSVCVECGAEVLNSLFHDYGEGTLRLTHCQHCRKVADKYVEYELILVCIDVILHRTQAFRHFLYNRRSLTHGIKPIRLIISVLVVATALKLAMLYGHASFKEELMNSPFVTAFKLLIYCSLEHLVFTMTLFAALSKSFPHLRSRDYIDDNTRLYHAIAFPELGKVFVAFLQVWDTEPTMPFIFAALMLSVQYSSLQCITASDAASVFRPFFTAVILRTMCRICFHSLHYSLALGIII